ncbi:MAG: Maf family nucleotide pyrophosphatase [Flavobacteriaceae bacterium]|nr:Maf family nucleotide pyrophosphatase [Flavobacteriaceae bacterium]
MLSEKLKNYNIILASGSPRRQLFFKEMNIDFTIQIKKIDEVYPDTLRGVEITDYLSKLKAAAFTNLSEKDILITSDTIVWHLGKAVEKPKDEAEAFKMIKSLSGRMHKVFTSVTFTGKHFQKTIHDMTKVWFNDLTDEEINYYIKNYKPFDKAGSYGIQEWLGLIGIDKIEGSYFNVMGLPTHLVYKTLMNITKY